MAGRGLKKQARAMREKTRSNDSQSISKDGEDYEMGLGKGEILGTVNREVLCGRMETPGRKWKRLLTCSSQSRCFRETEKVCTAPPRGETVERPLRCPWGENCLRD